MSKLLKQKIKVTRMELNEENKRIRRNATVYVSGRTPEELAGRVEKTITRWCLNGWELR